MRAVPGRPRIETDNEGILETVLQIATIGSACGEKRREDMVRLSAYNRAERKMYHLSKELAGGKIFLLELST